MTEDEYKKNCKALVNNIKQDIPELEYIIIAVAKGEEKGTIHSFAALDGNREMLMNAIIKCMMESETLFSFLRDAMVRSAVEKTELRIAIEKKNIPDGIFQVKRGEA